MHTPLPPAGSRLRSLIQRGIFVVVAVLVLRTWYVEGLIIPCRVAGGSMAETLLGVHRNVICDDCGHGFACGTEQPPARSWAICPNCGYADNDLGALPDLAGDRLLIHKSAFHFHVPGPWQYERLPRRWEVAAFRRPSQPGQICIKRIAGLPGESIRIRDGDVYVDRQIQRKTLWQQRALAVLVHDANARPQRESAPPSRWQGQREDSRWGAADGRFAHPSASAKQPVDWLRYRHWQRIPDPSAVAGKQETPSEEETPAEQKTPAEQETTADETTRRRFREGPITDRCGYNQMLTRREEEIHPVTDLMLSLRLLKTFGREGMLLIRVGDGRDEFEVRIDPNRQSWEVTRGGRPVPGAVGKLPEVAAGLSLVISLFDKQFLLAFDGVTVVARPYAPSPRTSKAALGSLAVGSQGLGVVIRDLRVYRDVYYTHPIGPNARWGLDQPVELAADEYFVLGDNSPISEDSRTWPNGPTIAANLLVGKPLLVHFPARHVKLGNWTFQVPDAAKIRYIR